jgi:hypothetical protein
VKKAQSRGLEAKMQNVKYPISKEAADEIGGAQMNPTKP